MIDLEVHNFLGSERSIQEELYPRDLLFLKNLTRYGLTLIEIKLSPICPINGKQISEIELPEGAILINVIHNERSHFPDENTVLENGDIVYFLASRYAENDLREIFTPDEYL